MKFFQNPVSGELKSATRLTARKLASYGWRELTRAEYDEIKREAMQYLIRRELKDQKVRLH